MAGGTATARQAKALHRAEEAAGEYRDAKKGAREAQLRMNAAVKQAHKTGVPYRAIASRVGLTFSRVFQIVSGE